MRTTDLLTVGFWRETPSLGAALWELRGRPSLPVAEEHVDRTWAASAECRRVLDYLAEGRIVATYRGVSRCRICHRSNGHQDVSDGIYLWPSGFAHYVREHGVKPPEAFLRHVAEQGVKP